MAVIECLMRSAQYGVALCVSCVVLGLASCVRVDGSTSSGAQLAAFDGAWQADGVLCGTGNSELFRIQIQDGAVALSRIDVQGSIAASSGVVVGEVTYIAGLDRAENRVSNVFQGPREGPFVRTDMYVRSKFIQAVGGSIVAVRGDAIIRCNEDPRAIGGVVKAREERVIDSRRRILAYGKAIWASTYAGEVVQIDSESGDGSVYADDEYSSSTLLRVDDRYLVQGNTHRVVFRNRDSGVISKSVVCPGSPVGVLQASSLNDGRVKYFVIVKYDTMKGCDIIDSDTGDFVRKWECTPVNVIQYP